MLVRRHEPLSGGCGMLWVEVLNRCAVWDEGGGAGPAGTDARIAAGFREDAELLRRMFTAAALARPLADSDMQRVSQWLAAVTPYSAGARSVAGFELPPFACVRRPAVLPESLDAVLSSAFLQVLAWDPAALGVQRCAGLVRGARGSEPEAEAQAWARAAGLEHRIGRDGWSQCRGLVLGPRGARYCSKSCSNAAFAVRKSEREPHYFAAKQQRYRDRQRVVEPRRPGAFVYMD